MNKLQPSMIESTRHFLPAPLIHDLRTPLNQIIGYSDMLVEQAQEGGNANFVPDLEKVRAAGHRMLGIIDDNIGEVGLPAPGSEVERDNTDALLLVVDDDEGNRDVLSRRLERLGYAVNSATGGLRALTMLSDESYEVVLLDIMMPEVDGYEVLRQIKAHERLRHIPVIMISALGDMESVAKCIELGADDYLPKPFNPTLLKARVGACLQKKRGRDREMRLFHELEQNYQRLKESEKLRDDLTHMIIHDLGTPLTSVLAAMQTLDSVGEINAAQREVVTIAVEGANSLLDKINGLLEIEKLEVGAMKLDLSLISLSPVLEASVAQIAPLAKAKDLKLILQIAPALPWLQADEEILGRILVNLLGNAIKFTDPGGSVVLEVRSDDDARSVEFCVRNAAESTPVEAHDRVLEQFGQGERRDGSRQMSTELGLTFCQMAVEAHGGQVAMESSPGQGSSFRFSLPLRGPTQVEVPTLAAAVD